MSDPNKDINNNNRIDDVDDISDEEKIRFWISYSANEAGKPISGEWMSQLVPLIGFHSASSSLPHPSVTLTFTVKEEHCNRLGNLHGGAAATLFDFCTTMPITLVSRKGYWQFLGVSRTLNVTYLRPVPAGTEVLIESEMISIGKNMAAIKGIMRRRSDGQILSICEHNKVNVDPVPML